MEGSSTQYGRNGNFQGNYRVSRSIVGSNTLDGGLIHQYKRQLVHDDSSAYNVRGSGFGAPKESVFVSNDLPVNYSESTLYSELNDINNLTNSNTQKPPAKRKIGDILKRALSTENGRKKIKNLYNEDVWLPKLVARFEESTATDFISDPHELDLALSSFDPNKEFGEWEEKRLKVPKRVHRSARESLMAKRPQREGNSIRSLIPEEYRQKAESLGLKDIHKELSGAVKMIMMFLFALFVVKVLF